MQGWYSPEVGAATKRTSSEILSGLLVALALYPLSLGPAVGFCGHGKLHVLPPHLSAFYQPLFWLYYRSTAVENGLDWYVRLWISNYLWLPL